MKNLSSARFIVLAGMLSIAACTSVSGDSLSIPKIIAAEGLPLSAVGIYITCLETDSVYASLNADTPYIPASVQKLVTGAIAYEKLGPTYTFKTKVYVDGSYQADSGIIRGNLIIRGGADLGFLAERLWLFVQHLYFQGVRSIEGDIILDDSFFDTVKVGPGFAEDQSSRPYESMIGALSANNNSVEVHFRPGSRVDSPVVIDLFPAAKDLKIESSAKTGKPGSGSTIDIRSAQGSKGSKVVVTGTLAVDAEPGLYRVKVWETAPNFGNMLSSLFQENGIKLKGKVKTGTTPDSIQNQKPFYIFESEPLGEYMRTMFKLSINFAAEMLFKTLGAEAAGGHRGSWEGGALVVKQWWKENNLPGMPIITNGSGMGKQNKISPVQIVALLKHVWERKDYYPDYCSMLPISGIDGTLKGKYTRSRLKGVLRAKTGSLNNCGSSTLAGYALIGKKTFAYAILINHLPRGSYDPWRLQEKILEKVLP
jgi:serine-type D-Ala-D-Ala carboxypeptidase/endopeptidase (penicillin-binding protein 4)